MSVALLQKDLAYKKRVCNFTPKKFYEIEPNVGVILVKIVWTYAFIGVNYTKK